MIGSNNELNADKAKQVSFGWYYYGKTQTPENWCTISYVLREDGFVEYSRSGPMISYIAPHREFYLGGQFSKACLELRISRYLLICYDTLCEGRYHVI